MRRILVLVLLAVAEAARGEAVAVGSRLTPLVLEDQHGVRAEVGPTVRLVLFTRDMDAGNLVRDALADRDQQALDARRAVYVADISAMPALVTKLMALPRMRKRPYRMLLDRDGKATRELPHAEGKVTLLELDDLRVTRVAHLGSVSEVRSALQAPAP